MYQYLQACETLQDSQAAVTGLQRSCIQKDIMFKALQSDMEDVQAIAEAEAGAKSQAQARAEAAELQLRALRDEMAAKETVGARDREALLAAADEAQVRSCGRLCRSCAPVPLLPPPPLCVGERPHACWRIAHLVTCSCTPTAGCPVSRQWNRRPPALGIPPPVTGLSPSGACGLCVPAPAHPLLLSRPPGAGCGVH